MKNPAMKITVALESTPAASPPKTLSDVAPPSAEPMPAFALGFCINTKRTTSTQTNASTVSAP